MICLSQRVYIQELLKQFNMKNCNSVVTSMIKDLTITDESDKNIVEDYLSLVESLQFFVIYIRSDISFAADFLTCWNSKSTLQCWKAAKQVLQYLKSFMNYDITFDGFNGYCLVAYSDADWAGDIGDCKSTTGFLIMIAGGSIYWCSVKQTGVSLSTTEVEYIAASETAKHVLTICGILEELDVTDKDFTFSLLVDNTGAIAVSDDEKVTCNTCHIDICYHHVWDLVEKGIIEILHIRINEMAADGFTKALGEIKFNEFRDMISVTKENNFRSEEAK